MSEVGALIIKLQAETAEFRADMGKVKSDLKDIQGGAQEAGEGMDRSFAESRGLMLTEEIIGVHVPRHLTALIAQIPAVGIAFSTMLPLIGVVAAIKIIAELIEKHDEAARKMAEAWDSVEKASSSALDTMENKLLSAQIKAAELSGDSLKALQLKLKEIDAQSMSGIVSEIDKIGKGADDAFKQIEHNWFMRWLMGDADVTPAKDELKGMIAEIDKMKQGGSDTVSVSAKIFGDLAKAKSEMDEVGNSLQKAKATVASMSGLGDTAGGAAMMAQAQKKVDLAQQEWDIKKREVETLQSIDQIESVGAKAGDANKDNAKADAAKKNQAELDSIYDSGVSYMLEGIRKEEAATAERVRLEKEAEGELSRIQKQNAEEDKKDAAEKMAAAQAETDGELKAVLAGAAEAEKADVQAAKNMEALHKINWQQTLNAEISAINARAEAEKAGYAQSIAALDKTAADHEKKEQEMRNKILLIDKKAVADSKALHDAADQQQLMNTQRVYDQMSQLMAADIAHSLVMNQSLVQSFRQTGEQILEAMIKNLIMMELERDNAALRTKFTDAKTAFHNAMADVPFPLNLVVAPAMFAATMAFEQGGKIPGAGAVPILAHGGESVVTRALTDRVESAEGKSIKSGGMTQHNTYAPQIHAMDAEGVDRVLAKHGALFARHVTAQVRRMNK